MSPQGGTRAGGDVAGAGPPIRGVPARLRLWALALAAIGIVPVLGAPFYGWHDWPAFWSAGSLAGTPALVDAAGQVAWQTTRGLPVAYFPYPPAVALIFVPFSWLPIGAGFVACGLCMLAALAAAGWHGGPAFGLSPRAGLLVAFAWAPATASIVIGQNAPLGLLLAAGVLLGLLRADQPGGRVAGEILAGLAAGLACYKPTFGLPLVGLLLLRRRRLALGVSLAVLAAGYVVSALAVGGDLTWPAAWLDSLRTYVDADFAANADKAASIPGLLQHAGVPAGLALAFGGVIVLASLPCLVRAGVHEAFAVACLVGVAASPHAWGYDAALLVPALLLLVGPGGSRFLAEPWRTRVIVVVFALGPSWLISAQTRVSGVAVAVIVLLLVFARRWWDRSLA